ncbi:flagellar export chaperone FliS [Paenibacillus gallinarum]|uniref:Flagellar secretion chaperone FliS n=1 Tax=Paenibacillus gallinarum TaxID=2762232 RepID=A0ABR8SZJ0_9BACL|nr:flagellar export chaperone FliS [Paenibacillus gallinarum]MBD7968936.1 flagellar export chaperone FliS [Paenibacillus gallinarum]
MIANVYDKYRQTSVQTSNPAQLVIMLYDGAIRFIKSAMQGLEINNFEQVNTNFGKAQTIISELMSTLNHDYEISKGLYQLYEYMNYTLIQANIKKKPEPAHDVLEMLTDLRASWLQASRIVVSDNSNG